MVVKEALSRAGVEPEQVDELMFGCILTAAQGQNPARQVGVKAGLPYSVPAYTVGMVCGSGHEVGHRGCPGHPGRGRRHHRGRRHREYVRRPYALPDERWGARMGTRRWWTP